MKINHPRIKGNRSAHAVALVIVVAFGVIQSLTAWNGGMHGVFNSPDENAYYHFADRIVRGEDPAIRLPEALGTAGEYLGTRSTRVVNGRIVPVGFLGLPVIYGFISKVLFVDLLAYLTILASSLAVYALYRVMREYASDRAALLSAVLLALHPAWWYYTNTSLYPNVLFVSLCIGAVYAGDRALRVQRVAYYAACGALLALALLVRGSEVVWLIPALAVVLWLVRDKLRLNGVVVALAALVLVAALGVAVFATLAPGVGLLGYNVSAISDASTSGSALSFVIPFGVHPRLILRNAADYMASLFWPVTSMFVVAAGYVWARLTRLSGVAAGYALVSGVVGAVILTVYGSWLVTDHPNPDEVTIGTSYVRYFLPVYVLMIPVIACACDRAWTQSRIIGRIASGTAITVMFATTLGLAILNPVEGLRSRLDVLQSYDRIAGWVQVHTPSHALMVTEKADKYLWPNRQVMAIPSTSEASAALEYLSTDAGLPVYYVGLEVQGAYRIELNELLERSGLVLAHELFSDRDVFVYSVRHTDVATAE